MRFTNPAVKPQSQVKSADDTLSLWLQELNDEGLEIQAKTNVPEVVYTTPQHDMNSLTFLARTLFTATV